ncbi:MAG: ABC transporter permease [Clostridiales bacterium]|nr:ABC transporter permease [Clostridiales bacterium]
MLYISQTALELGFLYALVAMALFLSYRILDIADMTTDGCFVLGTAVSVTFAASGHPFLAIPAAMFAGVCAGFVTAFLQTHLGVPSILAGIVTNMGLYTINLMAMGWSSNVSLLKTATIFTIFHATGIGGAWYEALLAGLVTIAAGVLLILFLGTRLGLSIRATGNNIEMVRASSINPAFTITVGLCVSNSLTALSGAMVGQYQNTADINAGTGIVVIGLACLIIGETVLGRRSMIRGALAAILGSIIYRFIYAYVLYTKIMPVQALKLVTAVVVALAIAFPSIKAWLQFQKRKMAAPRRVLPKTAAHPTVSVSDASDIFPGTSSSLSDTVNVISDTPDRAQSGKEVN